MGHHRDRQHPGPGRGAARGRRRGRLAAGGLLLLLTSRGAHSYAIYSLIGRALVAAGHQAAPVLGIMFGAAGLAMLPVLLASGTGWLGSWRGAAVALHLAACTTFLAYRLFGRGLRSTPAQVATTLTLAEPAVATLLGAAVLGERLPALSWCGLAVLAAGLACLAVPVSRRPGPARRRSLRSAPRPSGSCCHPGFLSSALCRAAPGSIASAATAPRRRRPR